MGKDIILKNLTLPFPLEALGNKEFHIPEGKITVIEGVSGRGKTTLLHVLSGVLPMMGGTYENHPKNCSVVFQEPRLVEEVSGVTNIQITVPEVEKSEIQKELKQFLPEEYLNVAVKEYSRGMKQKTAIVRAMVQESEMILMDEVFTGLDQESKAKVTEYILSHRNQRTLVLSAHQREDVMMFHPNYFISL